MQYMNMALFNALVRRIWLQVMSNNLLQLSSNVTFGPILLQAISVIGTHHMSKVGTTHTTRDFWNLTENFPVRKTLSA